jgi:putative flippase GtrA
MESKDWKATLNIGGGVGLLIQPILANNIPAKDIAYLTPAVRLGLFFFFLVLAPVALYCAKLLSRWLSGLYQFAKFAAVGTLNSFIYTGVLNLETFWYGSLAVSNLRYALFVAVSFLFSTTNSFLWNKYWTFNAREKTNAAEISGFYSVAAVGLVLSVAAATFVKAIGPADSKLWLNIMGPLAGIAVSFAWNFIGYKYWVFKDKK